MIHDIDNLAEVDGYSTWRENEANSLSNLVQERFKFLQNPTDCKTAKKLVCSLNKVSTKIIVVIFGYYSCCTKQMY